MSRSINKVILIGNVGSDPVVRYTPDGKAVANLSIATTDQWRDKATGEQTERTEWHRVVFFGKLAEIVNDYVRKGAQIYVEGRLQSRKWQDNDGNTRYSFEVVANDMQMLGSRRDANMSQAEPPTENQINENTDDQKSTVSALKSEDDFDDDIPF